jgi:multiple sugar transport system permease protein
MTPENSLRHRTLPAASSGGRKRQAFRFITRARLLPWLILGPAMLVALVPMLWAVSTAFKDPAAAQAIPPRWLPVPPTLENFRAVFAGAHLGRYLFNSTLVSLLTIGLTMLVAVHAGYAAARFEFPARRQLLFLILASAMIPGICILVPIYLLVSFAHLHDTYIALVLVYSAWQIPTATWIMRGYFATVPPELEEAALLDGCSRAGAFYRVILPLTQPGMAAVGILAFIYVWNDFIIAYALTISDSMRLVQSGLYLFVTAYGIEWSQLMAAVLIALLPPVVAFIALQGRFIQGLTSGALK